MSKTENTDEMRPYKIVSLKESAFTPPFDVISNSVYQRNAYHFMWDTFSITYWPELCIILVDTKESHYFGFMECLDLENCEYVIKWKRRTRFGLRTSEEPQFAMRGLAYAVGYSAMKSYQFEMKTMLEVTL